MKDEFLLRPMSDEEFAAYRGPSIISLAKSEAEALEFDEAESRLRAEAAFQRLVPDGKIVGSTQRLYVISA